MSIKVFEDRNHLRASKECNEVLNELGKYVDTLANKVHPKDLLAFQALVISTVELSFSVKRVKTYINSKKKK